MRTHDDEAHRQDRRNADTRRRQALPNQAIRAGIGAAPELLGPSGVLALQCLIGNAAVAQLLRNPGTDDSERPSPVTNVVGHGGGSPLDGPTRQMMESRLGADFSDVRVHTGPRAVASARSIGASAYTVGTDVVFGGGYDPASPSTQRTLAHELTHVVQQRTGPVDSTPAPNGIRISDPSDRFEREAERRADTVMAAGAGSTGPDSATVSRSGGPTRTTGTVQRLWLPGQKSRDEQAWRTQFKRFSASVSGGGLTVQRWKLFSGKSASTDASKAVLKGSAPAGSKMAGATGEAGSKRISGDTGPQGGGDEKVTSSSGKNPGPAGLLDGEAKRVLTRAARFRKTDGLKAHDYSVVTAQVRALARLGDQRGIVTFGPQTTDASGRLFKDLLAAAMLAYFVEGLEKARGHLVSKTTDVGLDWYYGMQDAYFAHAIQQRDRTATLIKTGLGKPEAQMFLNTYGFGNALVLGADQQAKGEDSAAPGPRIEVKSSFISDPLLGRMHLYLVYTTADGRQHYFRGGPGSPHPETDVSPTRVLHGPYFPGTVDWDPTAPSATVAKGDAAAGKLDSLIEAAGAIDAMGVPYVAVGGLLRGENCNATAWTLLERVGLPKKKPAGLHPGWGHRLGSYKGEGNDPGLKRVPHAGEVATKVAAVRGLPGTLLYGDRELVETIGVLAPGDIAYLVEWTKTTSAEQTEATSVSRLRMADGRTVYCAGKFVAPIAPSPSATRHKVTLGAGSTLDYGETIHRLDKQMHLDSDKAFECIPDVDFIDTWDVVPVMVYGKFFVKTIYVSFSSFDAASKSFQQAQEAQRKAASKASKKAKRQARKARKAAKAKVLRDRINAAIEAERAGYGLRDPVAGKMQTYAFGGGSDDMMPRELLDAEYRAGPMGKSVIPTGNTAGVPDKEDDWMLKSWVEKNAGVAVIEVYFGHEFRWVRLEEYQEWIKG